MKPEILIGVLLLIVSTTISAQFVGDGAIKPVSAASSATMKPTFSIKFGAAVPLSNFGKISLRSAMPRYSDGFMGAKTGFFAEAGMQMSLTNPDKMVGFYYFPILASYWQTSLDWSKLGEFFTNKEIYTKPVSVIDIGQRYGVVVKPIDNFFVALYYRPGLIIPLKFEITHESVSAGESFLFTGEMSTGENVPFFMMSHTAGLSVRYMMATLSLERYSARPTYDVQYKDIDTSPLMSINNSSTGKIPVKMLLISLALSF